MDHGLIIAGIAFLFIPALGVYDLMPDVIGYALIMLGLSKLAALNGDLSSSRRNFRYLLFITAVKTVLFFPLMSLRDEMTVMLYVFAFAIAETVFLIPAFSELCEGSYYLSSRSGCEIPDREYEDLRIMSRVFIIARAVLVAVPELTVLTNNAYKESVTAEEMERPTLYDSKNIITLGCAAVSLLIGAVFFVLAIRYFGRLAKDRGSVAAIRKRYEDEVMSNRLGRVYSGAKLSSSLFVAACVFLMPVYFYGVDVLPELAAAVLMLFALRGLKGYTDKTAAPAAIFAAVYAAASLAVELFVSSKYFNGSYSVSDKTAAAYTVAASVKAVGFMIFAVLIYLFYTGISRAVAENTKAPTFDEEGYKKSLGLKCTLIGVSGIVSCAVSAACTFAALYAPSVRFAGAVVFFAYAVFARVMLTKLCDEISRRL